MYNLRIDSHQCQYRVNLCHTNIFEVKCTYRNGTSKNHLLLSQWNLNQTILCKYLNYFLVPHVCWHHLGFRYIWPSCAPALLCQIQQQRGNKITESWHWGHIVFCTWFKRFDYFCVHLSIEKVRWYRLPQFIERRFEGIFGEFNRKFIINYNFVY